MIDSRLEFSEATYSQHSNIIVVHPQQLHPSQSYLIPTLNSHSLVNHNFSSPLDSLQLDCLRMSFLKTVLTRPLQFSASSYITSQRSLSSSQLLPTYSRGGTAHLSIMCTRFVHIYGCGHRLVSNAPCAESRGNGGRCPKGVKEKRVVHEEDCDACSG
jgi:hypothetical protein